MEQGLGEAALGGKGSRIQVESLVSETRKVSAPSGSGAKERTKRLNHTKCERKEQVARVFREGSREPFPRSNQSAYLIMQIIE